MHGIKNRLEAASEVMILALAIGLALLLGIADFLTGPQVAFSLFYLVPVALAEWRCGFGKAAVVAVIAANTWLVADVAGELSYDAAWIPIWNTTTRFTMFMIVAKLLSNLRAGLERQTELARTDPLTGLLNPRAFREAAQTKVDTFQQQALPFTFAYVDLDDFKTINDKLGHTGGDETLRMVAQGLRQSLRSSDVVGRFGGDEFAILLPATGSDAAKSVMSALIDRVKVSVSELPMDVTFSAGAATFLVPPVDVDELIRISDELMYQAKREGKNRYVHLVLGQSSSDAVPDVTPGREMASAGSG